MKWWQKKVRGWTFWYTDTPLCSYEFARLSQEEQAKLADEIRKSRRKINRK